ncbi:uncharacterized protein A1O5_07932 [Cladophialophora psammophila CBS 110553]|uniref:RWD domain-containing protein n=1 Tax=Cladophialophora psammophila CBS 110553 TaxID=1182543 RepID=W9WLG3_9EURO|nr:uncharacterized protein A1O5_07932 [Cladophialophora psammophila CBS 110553]EXJ68997.1 hypothetical protein A1O5_07932 [Cladophialophora psammophila CBS 110553]
MTSAETSSRLEAELSLLEAMYPGNITFDSRSRDLLFTPSDSQRSALLLRLPDQYPEQGVPEVISACDNSRNDIRDRIRRAIDGLGAEGIGVEVLDQVVSIFEDEISGTSSDLTACSVEGSNGKEQQAARDPSAGSQPRPRTVIIWLHHLLATSKRKLAVNPTASSPASSPSSAISGISKPGYPGIMVFSGPSDLVDSHLRELKALNWQVFQVRYDSDENAGQEEQERDEWTFSHGKGKIIEVESMAEVVKDIVKEGNKLLFLEAVGVK